MFLRKVLFKVHKKILFFIRSKTTLHRKMLSNVYVYDNVLLKKFSLRVSPTTSLVQKKRYLKVIYFLIHVTTTVFQKKP